MVRRPKVNGKAVSPISRTFPTVEEARAWRAETMEQQRLLRDVPPVPAAGLMLAGWAQMPPGRHRGCPVDRAPPVAEDQRAYSMDRLRLHVLPVLGDKALVALKATGDRGPVHRAVRADRETARPRQRYSAARDPVRAAARRGDCRTGSHGRDPQGEAAPAERAAAGDPGVVGRAGDRLLGAPGDGGQPTALHLHCRLFHRHEAQRTARADPGGSAAERGQAASVRAPVAAPGRRRRRAEVGPVSAAAAAVAGNRPRPMPGAKPSPTAPTHRSAHLNSGWIPSRVCRSRRTR